MNAVSDPDIYLTQLELGPMQNFVYLIGDTETRRAVAVDPAWDIDAVCSQLAADDMTLEGALITHFHPDHLGGRFSGMQIQGATELLARGEKIKVYVHKAEADYVPQICGLSRSDLTLCESGDEVVLGEQRIRLLHTPGHTEGSVCLYEERLGVLLTGDLLFAGSYGRTDLPGGDDELMVASLARIAREIPASVRVLPGHGAETTVERELPWLRRIAEAGRLLVPG